MIRILFLLFHLVLLGSGASRSPPNKLIAIKTNCTRELFSIKLDMGKTFKGVIFAKDFLDECRSKGELFYVVQSTCAELYGTNILSFELEF